MDTDRNLLFGVLALELEYFDSQRFTELCAEWAKNPSEAFSKLMVTRGCLKPDDVREIERLLQRKLAKHHGDMRDVLANEVTISARLAMLDADAELLRRTMSYLPSSADYSPIHSVSAQPDQRTRYTLTRVHGQGGLGRVWLAHDNHLNRPVALKEILPGKETLALENRRFVKEAQVTGQLEHPNIVPIYELAADASQGGSFYTMRFIRGRTLRAEIDAYHQKRREGTAGPLELQKLLQAFVSICHALAFAHSRGVIHRDLKPANVMLGSFGEVIVVDWGLAKLVDQPDDDDSSVGSGSKPISITESGSVEATQVGLLLGTLPYMAPEQAAGRIDLLDRRTDIYGLGAILFAILTGHTPHQGSTTQEIQSRIVNQPTPHARQAEASVAAPLDAVCAKAMTKEMSQRYATAGELADDVQRWLADEPVSVFRDPWTTRVARWTRRNRGLAIAVACSLVVISTVAVVSAVMINQARHAEQSARIAESKAKVEAANRLRDARSVLDTTLTQMSRELVHYPGVQEFRRMLLERAAADYERFAAEKSDDRELQTESGNAFLRLSEVYKLLEEPDKAIVACQSAEAIFQKLLRQTNSASFSLPLVAALRTRGGLLRGKGDLGAAESTLNEAQVHLAQFPSGASSDNQQIAEAAQIWIEQSHVAAQRGDQTRANERLLFAIAELEKAKGDFTCSLLVASAYGQQSIVLSALGQAPAAVAASQKGVEGYKRLLDESPNSPELLEGHATSTVHWAIAARALGRIVDELQAYQSAIGDYTALVKARPELPQYRLDLVVGHHNLAQLFQTLGRNLEAKASANEALGELEYLLKHFPNSLAYHDELAVACITLGRAHVALGDDTDSETQFLAASKVFQNVLVPAEPGSPSHWRGLGITSSNLGRLRQRQLRLDDAVKLYQQAIEYFGTALARQTDASIDHATHNFLAWSKTYLGESLWQKGDSAAASAAFAEARALREALPQLPEYLASFARLLMDCDDVSQRDLPRAAQLADEASKQSPEHGQFVYVRALARYRAGNWSECEAFLNELKNGKLRLAPNGFDGLLESMVQWQLQKHDEARRILAETLASQFANEHAGSIEFQKLALEAKTLIGQ